MDFAKVVNALNRIVEALKNFNLGLIRKIYPVGSIYISTLSSNPAALLGFGTWQVFGAGKALVSLDSSDADFDTVEETRGSKTHQLTEAELAAHDHNLLSQVLARGGGGTGSSELTNAGSRSISSVGSSDDAGSDTAHNNIQPSIVVYIWKRIT